MLTLWLTTGVIAKTTLAPGAIAGQTSLTFSTTAELSTDAQIAASSALTFATTADLTGSGSAGANIEGATSLTFTPAGALLGNGSLVGASSVTFTPTADLTGSGGAGANIEGASSLTFTPSATLSGDAVEQRARGGSGRSSRRREKYRYEIEETRKRVAPTETTLNAIEKAIEKAVEKASPAELAQAPAPTEPSRPVATMFEPPAANVVPIARPALSERPLTETELAALGAQKIERTYDLELLLLLAA